MRVAIALLVLVLAGTAVAQPLMTKSQAKAVVRDVNLKASDMPGYDSVPSDPESVADLQTESRLAHCYGGVSPTSALATGSSPVFLRGSENNFVLFGSIVTVFRKSSVVRKDLRALRSARARECFRAAIEQANSRRNVTVTVATLHTAVAGVFGYRFTTTPASDPGKPLYSDFFFMGTRAGEARLIVNAIPTAPAQSLDDRVIRIVKTRLRARLDPNTIL